MILSPSIHLVAPAVPPLALVHHRWSPPTAPPVPWPQSPWRHPVGRRGATGWYRWYCWLTSWYSPVFKCLIYPRWFSISSINSNNNFFHCGMAIDLMLSVIFFGRKWEMPVEFLDVSPNKLFPITFLGHYLHLFRTSTDSHSRQLQVGPTCAMSCCFIASEGWLKIPPRSFGLILEIQEWMNIYKYLISTTTICFWTWINQWFYAKKRSDPQKKIPPKCVKLHFFAPPLVPRPRLAPWPRRFLRLCGASADA